MVNRGLKSLVFLAVARRSKAGLPVQARFGREAALTNQSVEPGCHQKLFWPSRFMVY
jgi:hypothetical protein